MAASSIAIATTFPMSESVVYQPGSDIDAMLALAAAKPTLIVKHSGIGVDDETLERRILELQQDLRSSPIWDVDAPATIARMHANPQRCLSESSMPQYDAVLTYGGGPWCREEQYLASSARSAYFSMYNGLDP